MSTTIRVDQQVYDLIAEFKTDLEQELARPVSMSQAVRELMMLKDSEILGDVEVTTS